jgi:hypothetical protein
MMTRESFSQLSDDRLLSQCDVDTYRASGPGGQKRNKTSSAVRLRHGPTGLIVIAEESRSQHENKAKALKRLRRTIYLELREALTAEWQPEPFWDALRDRDGRLSVPRKHPHYWPAVARLLDLLLLHAAQVSTVAEAMNTPTASVIAIFEEEPHAWQAVNRLRAQFEQKPLRSG